jgi:hypothetical protein
MPVNTIGSQGVHDIGNGKSLWTGIFTSFRPAWKLLFNVDMANKPGYEEQQTMEFAAKFLSRSSIQGP